MDAFEKFFRVQRSIIPNGEHLPAYKILQIALLSGIKKGIWQPGDVLPPERELASICRISVGTVKRAMLELVHQGVLFRQQGSGTFVSSSSFNRQHRRYYLLLKDFGGGESANTILVHSIKKIRPIPEISEKLQIIDDELFEIIRIFSEDGKKCIATKSYFQASKFPNLDKNSNARFEKVPLYILLEDDYKVTSIRTEELFGVILSSDSESSLLDVSIGTPLLIIKALTYSHNNIVFEYRISYCLTSSKYLSRTMER